MLFLFLAILGLYLIGTLIIVVGGGHSCSSLYRFAQKYAHYIVES